MNLDSLYNHARDSLASARKSLYTLLDELRNTTNNDYSSVADVITSIAEAEADLDGLANKWVEEAEQQMHGEGVSYEGDIKQTPKQRLVEDKWHSLEELTAKQELDFSKFFPGIDEDE